MKASASSGRTPAFCASPPVLTSTKQARSFADPIDFARERCGDSFPVDRLDHVESLHRLPRLIALQRADQMKLDRLAEIARAGPQIAPFRNSLLHPVLAEARLAGARDCGPHLVGGKGLRDGDKLDRFRLAPAIARPPRDRFPEREKPCDGLRARSHSARPTKLNSVAGANSAGAIPDDRATAGTGAGGLTTPACAVYARQMALEKASRALHGKMVVRYRFVQGGKNR